MSYGSHYQHEAIMWKARAEDAERDRDAWKQQEQETTALAVEKIDILTAENDALRDVLKEALFWLDGWLLPKNAHYWDLDQYEAAQTTSEKVHNVLKGNRE